MTVRSQRALLGLSFALPVSVGALVVVAPALSVGLVAVGALVVLAFARPVAFTLTAVPVLLLVPPTTRFPALGLPDVTPQRAVLLLCLLVLLSRRVPLPKPFLVLAAAFAIYALVLAALHGTGMNRAVLYAVEPAVPLLAAYWAVKTQADARRLVDGLLVAVSAASVLALYEEVTRSFLFPADGVFFFHAADRGGWLRVQSVFPHPLVLGLIVCLLMPLAIVRFNEGRKLLGAVAAGSMGTALFFTFGRGPLLAAGLGIVVLAMVVRGRSRAVAAAAVALSALVVAASPLGGTLGTLFKPLVGIATVENGGYAVQYRQQLWHATTAYVASHPFGAGPGAALNLYANVGGYQTDLAASVDNAYAKYALELGWPGLILFLLMIGWLVRGTRRCRDPLCGGIFAGQVALLAASLTVASFTWSQVLLLFWALAGTALAAARWSG